MIQSFGNKMTQDLFTGKQAKETRHYPAELHRITLRKLALIDYATQVNQLKIPPGNRLEKLRGDYIGFYSLRVNDQWRVIFKWSGENATDVSIIDYH